MTTLLRTAYKSRMADPVPGPLAGILVLDLATARAELAGRTLADLGADVIKIEPPGGTLARGIAPFDTTGGSRAGESLYWAALALGKRSAVLDLTDAAQRQTFLDLVARADVLIESFDPGTTATLGIDYGSLSAINPGLIYMSVTPYGQIGPKANWPASDLTLEAACGRLSLQGDRDRPPVPIGYPQASMHSGGQAACDVIIALNERAVSGLGQHIDLSMQEAMIWSLMDATGYPSAIGEDPPGAGDQRALYALPSQAIPCDDGWVNGRIGNADLYGYTKAQLMRLAVEQDVRIAPINTTADLFESPQFEAREFWTRVGGYVHPGVPVRLSRTPAALRTPAPGLGEGQSLIDEIGARTQRAVPPDASTRPRPGLAFEGLKVADFSWVAVGPITGKAFADHGATVVRVESSTRLDVLRGLPPFKNDYPEINSSQWFANMNTSKLGLALNLGTSEGKLVARRLIDWADVVIESFTPGTMKKLGLDYATVSAERPELIMLSTCLLGQTGPYATYGGFGGHGAAIAGIHAVTGWPDRSPCGPSGPYSDVVAPRYTVAALAAAIFERRTSGLGQHIDVSQVEAAMHFLEPLVLDQSVNGVTAPPAGMRSYTASPHGVYRTAGRERYIAIAVETAGQWTALRRIAPLEDFAGDGFLDIQARRAVSEKIDAALAAWAAGRDLRVLEASLIEAGVPCSAVQRPSDLYRDPQLQSRGFFVPLQHTEMGTMPYDGFASRFSARQTMLRSAAPCLGEHSEFVLRELLKFGDEEIIEGAAAGAFH